jgi:hypothetical protein
VNVGSKQIDESILHFDLSTVHGCLSIDRVNGRKEAYQQAS